MPPSRRRASLRLVTASALVLLAACAGGPEDAAAPDHAAADPPASPPETAAMPESSILPDAAAHRRAVDAWHAERLAALRAEDGWLTLVALAWLEPGDNVVGAEPGLAVSHAGLPAPRLGTLRVTDDAVRWIPPMSAEVLVEGVPADGRLRTDADAEGPTILRAGSCRFHVIERAGRLAVRMKDAEAPTRTGFTGIERWPVSLDWRVVARYEPSDDGETVDVDSVIGTTDETAVVGRACFEHGGADVRLVVNPGGAPDRGFVVFGDTTNGAGSYPAGRFLLVEIDREAGTVILDFNRAVNPPCAFTAFATCPLPVEDNRLPFAVEAGERFGAGTHG